MRRRLRVRRAVNLANGSTLAGLGIAAVGNATLARGPDGLFVGTGYRLPVPPAPAFCLGNVIVTRLDAMCPGSPLWSHEARHATQFAWCGGVLMVPAYLAAAGISWVLTGDFGSRNPFERLAGLTDGGYTDKPLRPAIHRVTQRVTPKVTRQGARGVKRGVSGSGRRAGAAAPSAPGPEPAARGGSPASPSR